MLLRAALPLLLLASCASQPKPKIPPGMKYLQTPLAEIDKAAQNGEAEAQFELAEIYELGIGVPADPARARTLYASAAKSGHLQARLMSAFCQQEGIGGAADRGAALDAFLQLDSEGCGEADFALGNFFAYGSLRSPQMAEHWYWRGLRAGDASSASALRALYQQERDADRRVAQLLSWYEALEDRGNEDLKGAKPTLLGALLKQKSPDVDRVQSLLSDLKEVEFPGRFIATVRGYESQVYERGLGVKIDLDKALTLATPERTLPDAPIRDSFGRIGSLSRLRLNLKLGKGDPRQLWYDWGQACSSHPDAEAELLEFYSRLPPYAQFEEVPASAEFELRLKAALLGAPVGAKQLERLAKALRPEDLHRGCHNVANFCFSRHRDAAIPEPAQSFLKASLLPQDWQQLKAAWEGTVPCPRPVQSQRWNQQQFQKMMSGWNETVKNLEKPKSCMPAL
ncbi:MAG: hypothetical protein RL095_2123 [Verrucomicrobiota bacterium]|jgi:hypothetical protein